MYGRHIGCHCRAQRQRDLEATTLPRHTGAGCRQLASHQAGELTADGQAQTRTIRHIAPVRRLHEGLEDRRQISGRDARAAILDGEMHVAADAGCRRRRQLHRQVDAPRPRELDGIAQQVDQHLAQLAFVGVHKARHVRRPRDAQRKTFGCRALVKEIA